MIEDNIKSVREKVSIAAKKAGRDPKEIVIVAVTKTVDPGRIREAMNCGITELGENRVQELQQKIPLVDGKCSWHMIGHLQTNKVKYLIDNVRLIHSLDSLNLAREIQKRSAACGLVMDVLVQVNVALEETKSGISKDDTMDFLRKINNFSNLNIRGLMTIAPYTSDPEEVRWVFRELRELSLDIQREQIENIHMDSLSMGMSNDYEIAIEEGANIVRIGSAIFGERG